MITPDRRLRIRVAASAAMMISSAAAPCGAVPHSSMRRSLRPPITSAAMGRRMKTPKIVASVNGSEPRCVAAVTRSDRRRAMSSTQS